MLFARCANQQSPGGGEVDTVPPLIKEIFPENGTVNYHEDYFEISFSEYVDKRSVQEAIFISPALHIRRHSARLKLAAISFLSLHFHK